MKLKTHLLVATLSLFAASTVLANEEHHVDARKEKAEVVKSPDAATNDKSMKSMDMHEHMKMMHDMHPQKGEAMPMKKPGAGMDNQMHDLDKQDQMKAGMSKMKPATVMDNQMHDLDKGAQQPATKPATTKGKQNDKQMHDLDK